MPKSPVKTGPGVVPPRIPPKPTQTKSCVTHPACATRHRVVSDPKSARSTGPPKVLRAPTMQAKPVRPSVPNPSRVSAVQPKQASPGSTRIRSVPAPTRRAGVVQRSGWNNPWEKGFMSNPDKGKTAEQIWPGLGGAPAAGCGAGAAAAGGGGGAGVGRGAAAACRQRQRCLGGIACGGTATSSRDTCGPS
jgi:hypothetical protein